MPCFPPSYKRLKDTAGDCGDYSDHSTIINGYYHPGETSNDNDNNNITTSSITNRDSEVKEEKKRKDNKKNRPPSYTDRILIHSLPDRKNRLTIQAYDFCDTLRASDHRAVSMTVLLEVNSNVSFQNSAPIESTSSKVITTDIS